MTRRRITVPRVPMVGGKPETFVCVFVIAQDDCPDGPARICRGSDPMELKRRIQVHHWLPLAIRARFWVADMGLATRIDGECKRMLVQQHLRGGWYDIDPMRADEAIRKAANKLHIPILSDADYRKLVPTREQIDEILLKQTGATTGGLRAA